MLSSLGTVRTSSVLSSTSAVSSTPEFSPVLLRDLLFRALILIPVVFKSLLFRSEVFRAVINPTSI